MSDDLSGFSLIDLFRSEADANLGILSTGLLALEGMAQPDSSMVEPLMRAAHSLKGAARIVGLDAVVAVAHAMEDCLVAVQNRQCKLFGRHVDTLLEAVDFLNNLAQLAEDQFAPWATEHQAEVDGMAERVQAILTDQTETKPTSAAVAPQSPTQKPPQEPAPKAAPDLSGFSLIDLFRAEAETHLATLSEGLLSLERAADPGPGVVEPMMRAAHSIKGAARIVGLDPAVSVAHALEDCFVAVQKRQCRLFPRHVDILLRALDLLTQASQLTEAESANWGTEHEGEIATTVDAINGVLTDQAEGPAPSQLASATPPVEKVETPTPAVSIPEPQPTVATTTRATQPAQAPPLEPEIQRGSLKPAAASASPAPSSAAPAEGADRVVRVTAENLTRLMSLAGESLVQSRQLRPFVDSLLTLKRQQSALLDILQTLLDRGDASETQADAVEKELLTRAKQQAGQCSQMLGDRMEEFEDFARRNEDLSGRLHHEVLSSRMRPLADGVRGFPRLVRDISRQLGKQVKFEVVGEITGVDRDILEKLEAPLNHLIRNGLDHAIEMPAEREAAGKPAQGTIRLEARHRAGMLQITLTDDGRGIDPSRLRTKVVERGLATPAMASQMTEAELFEFLFLPGFSTKEKVTEISGRGVGLDVVQNMVREVGGFVRVSSQLGIGTRFTLQLPITMSVIRALLVRVAGEPYAFPLNRIDRIVMVPSERILVLEGRQHFMMDGEPVGLVEACQVLELPGTGKTAEAYPVVVASDRSHRFGVVVETFLGERDLEVRPLDTRLGKVPNINSASVLEDGWPVLIFDVEDLVRSVDNMLSGRRLKRLDEAEARSEVRGTRRVLVVDDSITVRELERQLLESAGYEVEVAVDGVDGWNAVRGGEYHLVISDVDMPRMDGIGFVTHIKQDPSLRSTPVIIVSYKDREEDRMRGLDAGANAYLTKSSFRDETFLKTVVDLIGEATG